MIQYIPKSVVVAEIERRIKETESMQPKFDQFWAGQISAFKGILKILDTLEVKEVNLEKETPNKELEDEILALNKRYPEVSFAKLSRIAVRIAKWQKEQDKKGE